MIKKMREFAPVIMLIILVAFVGGTIFMNWGMNLADRGRKVTGAGKINGQEIPLSYFEQQVNAERQKLMEGKEEIPPYQNHMIPAQVWEREVNKVLMQDVIKKMKLDASVDEVFEYIKNNPLPGIDTASAFQTDGVFDTSKYAQFLNDPQNYNNYPWLREVESYTKAMIIPSQKLEKMLNAAVMPTRSEIEFVYKQKTGKTVFEYIAIPGKIGTVDTVAVNDGMISTYYQTHKAAFEAGEQVALYFVKFPKKATDADETVYREELKELRDRITQSGKPLEETFAEEATIESDDQGSAAKGGDLGWFAKGAMVSVFDSVAFSQPVGTISDPVKSSFGLHIIYVEGREERDGELNVKARHILRKISPTIETIEALEEQADSIRVKGIDIGLVAAARGIKGVTLDSTELFEKGSAVPGIGYLSGVSRFAFGSLDEPISERIQNKDALYLFAIRRQVKKGVLPLADATEEIRGILYDSLQTASARLYAEKVRSSLVGDSSLTLYSGKDTLVTSGTTDTVSGSIYIPGIGYSTPVAAEALALPVQQLSSVIAYQKNFYIIRTLWKNTIDSIPSLQSSEMQQIAEQLQQQSSQKVYYAWYLDYKKNAKIKSNINELYLD